MKDFIYESPDKGETVYRRKIGELDREEMMIDDLMMAGLEEKAAELEITVDYYMMEFM